MYLLIGIIIGTIYGRNVNIVNERAYEDIRKISLAFSKTKTAATGYFIMEAIYLAFERKLVQKNIYTHDILCTCNRRACRPLKIETYVKRIKATN